jgi:surfactin synthase thioesterase subunit
LGAGPGRTYVLVPFAGGGAHSLADWLPVLMRPGDTAFLVQYPGRGPRAAEPFPATLAELADEAAGALERFASGAPILIGHSMGAVLAYEMARRLEPAGRTVPLLVVSGSRPPHRIDLDPAQLGRCPTEEWVRLMRADGFAGTDQMPPDLLVEAVASLRSDCLLVARYARMVQARAAGPPRRPAPGPAPGPAVGCRLLVLGGAADAGVPVEQLREWAAVTTGPADTCLFPGGHFYYRDHLADVGRLIERTLAGTGTGTGTGIATEPRPVSPPPAR